MTSFGDVLELALSRQASEKYPACREDVVVPPGCAYDHPPVLHFVKEFSLLPGAVETLSIDGLKDPRQRFSEIDAKGAALFSRCTGLRYLSMQYVHLRSFEGLGRHALLQRLLMQGNRIETFKGLLHLPSLEELNLWGNLIRGFKFFPLLPKLRELNVTCNRVEGGLRRLAARAPRLRVLRLGMNPLSKVSELLPLLDLECLDTLELFGCPVATELASQPNVFVEKLRSRGVRVVLHQHSLPPEMVRHLEQLKEDLLHERRPPSAKPESEAPSVAPPMVAHSLALNGEPLLTCR